MFPVVLLLRSYRSGGGGTVHLLCSLVTLSYRALVRRQIDLFGAQQRLWVDFGSKD